RRSPASFVACKVKACKAYFGADFPAAERLYSTAMSFAALPERLAQVRVEIARRASQPVTIVAVTKGFGTDAIRAAVAAGIADIGENRVQEAVGKQEQFGAGSQELGMRWHLIGHLQRNKAKLVPGRFELVHSLDSLDLATELDKRAASPLRVLLQVNVAGEAQKRGGTPGEDPAAAPPDSGLPPLGPGGLVSVGAVTGRVSGGGRA